VAQKGSEGTAAAAPTTKREGLQPKAPHRGELQRRQERLAWVLVIPTLLVVLGVAFYPLVQVFITSLTNARLGSVTPPVFVGLRNYVNLVTDADFLDAIIHTIIFTVGSVFFELVLGMIFALVINSQFPGRGVMRTAMLIPWAIPTVVSAQMWKWMYNDVFGVINDFLVTKVHLLSQPIAWIARPDLALPAIIAVDVWKTTPFMALLLLAGLQLIPNDVYEAATVDGANKLQQFWNVTVPLLRPAILVALIFRTLDALRVFDVIYVMTKGASGTESMATYDQKNLVDFQLLGYGSAISVAIFVLIGIFVVLYVTTVRVEET
jgi:trehalose/maltose transport system permease protein